MQISSLKNERQFLMVNKGGQKIYAPYFILIVQQNFTLNLSTNNNIYLGFKVSKKVGNAVVRNKVKRRIRHIIKLLSTKVTANNYGMIIIPKKIFATTEFAILYEQFIKSLHSIRILKNVKNIYHV